MVSFEKLSYFFASQTSDLHLKKLGGWALDLDTAQLLTRIVKITSPINVLEFGSGTSTVILGRALREFPKSALYSVENEIEFLLETQKFLLLNKLSNVELVHAPIQKKWYAEGPLESLPIFDLIFIDGPKENRINSIDFIESHSKATTIFVIDDYGSIETEGLVEVLTENGKRGLKIFAGDKRVAMVGKPLYLEQLITLL
jgi:predicted O-methyltransferase YrrM